MVQPNPNRLRQGQGPETVTEDDGRMDSLLSWMRGVLERFRTRAGYVWIVQHDESPHNTILGVFGDQQSAADYADEMGYRFPNGVIWGKYKIGYRSDVGGERYHEPLL